VRVRESGSERGGNFVLLVLTCAKDIMIIKVKLSSLCAIDFNV